MGSVSVPSQPPAAHKPSWAKCVLVPVLALSLSGAAAAQAPVAAGSVLQASGDTMLVRDRGIRTPLRQGEAVRGGDRIVTGEDGRVQLGFTDGGVVSIRARSDFGIDDYAFDATSERSFFTLARGIVHAISGRIGKRDVADYRIKTPTATIGIRGTEFVADVRRCEPRCEAGTEAGLALQVIAGRVAVTTAGGTVEVPQGGTLFVSDAAAAAGRPPGPAPQRAAPVKRAPPGHGELPAPPTRIRD